MSAVIQHEYFPAVKLVMNHDIMNCTAEGVVGNHLYSGRALGLSEPWDIIQLHPELKPHWQDIKDHYQRIGLSYSEQVIWDLDLSHLGAHIEYQPSVFFFGPHECRYWGDHQWLDTVEFINSKNNFIALANDLGVDVPTTLCFDNVTVIDQKAMQKIVYPCYLKAAISVSGVGIYRCENETAFIEAVEKFDQTVPVQVQEEVIADSFLNMQYQVLGDSVVRLAASEQILDGFVHQGNRVPASHEPWEAVDAMAYWLRDHGMKGIFAFDVAVVKSGNGYRFPVIECNPRFNGASYPTLVAKKLGIKEWSAVNFTTQYRNLSDIDLADIEYDQKTGEGAVIINWGTVLAGKLFVLMAGSEEYQKALTLELNARL